MSGEVRFEVLGPVRRWDGQAELDLGSPQQRAVLVMLLLAPGRQVPLDGLIDGLWGMRAPRSARGTVRTYISRLRRLFGADVTGRSGEQIESAGDGYILHPGSAVLDLDVFEKLHREARVAQQRDEAAEATLLLREALGLWRGAALAGVPGPYADSRRVQLSELHMTATEEKVAAEIAMGDHSAAIAELWTLQAEHPFRERLGELLMLALYRSGRQAEALDVFDSERKRLREELGIEPGPSLQSMRQRVLQADHRLMASAGMFSAQLVGAAVA
jgi:DNA-binding SARP family transcriptional activator